MIIYFYTKPKLIYWISTHSHDSQQAFLEEKVMYSSILLEVNMKHDRINHPTCYPLELLNPNASVWSLTTAMKSLQVLPVF